MVREEQRGGACSTSVAVCLLFEFVTTKVASADTEAGEVVSLAKKGRPALGEVCEGNAALAILAFRTFLVILISIYLE